MGKDCWTCGHAGTGRDFQKCEVFTVRRGHGTIASWVDDWTEDDAVTAKPGAPDCPGWTEDDRVTATPEPPEADPRLLAMANGELADQLAAARAEIARLTANATAREGVMRREADQLREAQRERDALAARVRELEAAVAEKGRVIVKMRAALDWSREEGRQEERAAVAAWLREVAETMNHNGDRCCGRVEDLASAVERGEHRREEKP